MNKLDNLKSANKAIAVVGAGLAGCEAAFSIANAGYSVTLFEMKPEKSTPAHTYSGFAELVCSNSLKAKKIDSASGLLKEEMRRLGSVCISAAHQCEVPAGGALAVDREKFSDIVTDKIKNHPLITVKAEEVTKIPARGEFDAVIIATGPLTSGDFASSIQMLTGEFLSFYDAAAPIVSYESIDMENAFRASRYGRDGDEKQPVKGDYINCPLNREEYDAFYLALLGAEKAQVNEFDKPEDRRVYEGCMPIETLASRGRDTMRFGPMKPVGLRDPKTGHRPHAVLQLRAENTEGSMWGLVGFQTSLRFGEQKRVFGMIPALRNADFMRYGVMHRNTFLNSPKLLNADYSFKSRPDLFFVGQITGVEGYMESAMSGLLGGKNAVRFVEGRAPLILPRETMMGALTHHVASSATTDYQPMAANFGIMPALEETERDKRLRYQKFADRSVSFIERNLINLL